MSILSDSRTRYYGTHNYDWTNFKQYFLILNKVDSLQIITLVGHRGYGSNDLEILSKSFFLSIFQRMGPVAREIS
jgi:hypothetical protein